MPIFRRKSLNSTETPTTMTVTQLLNMLNNGGASSTEMSEATYFTCLKILSESLGKLPLHIMQYTESGGVQKAYKHPLYSVLAYKPNPYMTASTFWATMENNRNQYGNAFALVRGFGSKTQLYPLQSEDVNIVIDNKGVVNKNGELWYSYTQGGETFTVPQSSMLHVKTSTSFDGITGASVRDVLQATVEGGNKSQAMLNGLYDTNFTSKVAVTYTGNLNDDLATKFVKGIEKYATGQVDGAKSVLPIPLGSTVTPLTTKLADNQFLELRRYSALQIAAAFGIKPNQINDYEKASYAAAEQQQLAFLIDTLMFILKQYEEIINGTLLSADDIANGYFAKFNISAILRADFKTQIDTLQAAVNSSLYTPNEARVFLDKPSMAGGDVLYCNGSMIPLSLAEKGANYKQSEVKNDE